LGIEGQVDRILGYAEGLAEDTAHQLAGYQAVGADLRGFGDRDPDAGAQVVMVAPLSSGSAG
jgi:hypothetical protein